MLNSNPGKYLADRARRLADESYKAMIAARPGPKAWTGKGLPPVGTECEVRFSKDSTPVWERATVVYQGYSFGAVKFQDGEISEFSNSKPEAEFRVALTAEQIAAEERANAVQIALSDVENLGIDYVCKLAMAERMIDSGWKKQVTQ